LTSVGTITSGTWHGSAITNNYLANSTIVVNGVTLTLGDTNDTIKASTTNSLTFASTGGVALNSTFDGSSAVTIDYHSVGASPVAGSSSIVTVGTITSGVWHGSAITNNYLANSTIVVNGVTLSLGDTNDTIKASTTNVLTIGTGLTGSSFDGSNAVTIAIDSSVVATHSYVSGLNYITLGSLSVGTPNSASGSGSISYSNTTGVFTYTPPDLSGYVTASTLSGYNYITLTSLSMDTPGSASGSGSVTYSNTTGKFKYTPPDLSSYITANVATLSNLTTIGSSGVNTTAAGNLIVTGNLTVNGTTETINATTSTFADKNIELGTPVSPATASDTSANGGGITLHGTTDKTLNWVLSTTAWTASENFDLASGKTYKINGTDVLSSTTLGSGVTSSSLTSVGTLLNLTVTNTITGSITGNAGTVTNGVYTTGSYANPSWITSLAYSKLTGAPTNVSSFTNDANYITTSSLSITTNSPGTESLTYSAGVFTFTPYKLPTAVAGTKTTGTLGGVIPDGTTITINNGVISSVGGGGGSYGVDPFVASLILG
jgi:hypothetical protein